MDYRRILQIIEKKFEGNFEYIITEIKNIISIGSTGGEISSMVGKYLKDLKIKDTAAYLLIEEDIERYLHECAKAGLKII